MKNKFLLLLSLSMVTGFLYGQTATLSAAHDNSTNGGSISIEIQNAIGQILDNSEFCFLWNGPDGFTSTQAEPSSLDFGTYCVKITDCNFILDYTTGACVGEGGVLEPKTFFGCVTVTGATCTDQFITFDAGALTATPSAPSALCVDDNSGSASYDLFFSPSCPVGICRTIDWFKNGVLIDQTFSSGSLSNIGPGEYCVHISNDDSFPGCVCDCEAFFCITIASVEDEYLDLDSDVTDATCNNSDGSIDLTITGGAEPYDIVWDNGDIDVTSLSNLAVGEYCVTITDDCGSVEQECFTISDNCDACPPLVVDVTATDHSWCRYYNTMTTGSVNVNITSGSGDYSIFVENLWTGETWDYIPTLAMFEFGEFCVTVTDNLCGNVYTECVTVWFYENVWCGPKEESSFLSTYNPSEFNSRNIPISELENTYLVNDGKYILRRNYKRPEILINNGIKGIQAVYDVFETSTNSFVLHTVVIDERSTSKRNGDSVISTDVILSPNPASDNVQLTLSSDHSDKVLVEIYDVSGRVVLSQKTEIIKGVNHVKLETVKLETGTYMVTILGYETEKLVIVK